jgi:hypothetical protein
MSKLSKQIKLVVKSGVITSIYDDALVSLFADAATVNTSRASNVEPDGAGWMADLAPVGGPILKGFTTRQDALDAEVQYLNRHIIK